MATDEQSTVLGVVILARHGDREGFYQDPETYTASATSITPLGEEQEFQLGTTIRDLYFDPASPSFIQGIANASVLFQQSQVQVRADAGGEGGVIFDSAVALTQGLWPPTPLQSTLLANGTNVTSPLSGYQYIPIESVEPNEDVSLEGFTDCNTFDDHTTAFYNSAAFAAMNASVAQFLEKLGPYMDGRPVTLENMWNIFDYMNVQSIHNATFANALPNGFLPMARYLADWHEYNVFSDTSFNGIGNIAFRTMIPSVVTAMQRIANASDPLKLHYSAIAYKPFLSLFNMTGVVADGALPESIVNYAASVVLEVRQPASGSGSAPVIRFMFKNGTDDAYRAYPMRFPGWDGTGANAGADVPLATFVGAFAPAGVNTTLEWCNVCGQTQERGCAALFAGNGTGGVALGGHHDRISPVGAGFLGAGLAVAVFGLAVAALVFLGLLTVGRRGKGRSGRVSGRAAEKKDHVELGSAANSISKESA
ncbi:phosphoglycerate mutase-like protein [Dichomitus squalens LYAD-421 SS1]|uniref:Phosphoglycerate mutase-like protein n=1 Tax=Dichomitus squalens (strain LYAD-421) TaxID=732165 RepID=R7SY43_DICSQ|nr:phosphoglycerate mutase-like protein [Dichomitus squalens LYAD-421 SS1]EJF61011.1 phosphoglycerate mutase-like protein [Dichomitus squalens LYAD-421 SS1]